MCVGFVKDAVISHTHAIAVLVPVPEFCIITVSLIRGAPCGFAIAFLQFKTDNKMHHKIKVNIPVRFNPVGNLHDERGPHDTLCTEALAADPDLEYRAVTITDLSAIMALYREHSLAEGNRPHSPFTVSFGLPVYQAVYKNTVVGYSFYTVQDGSASLRYYVRKGWDQKSIEAKLILLSKDAGGNTFSASSRELFGDASRLQDGIEQLVGWLNRCI